MFWIIVALGIGAIILLRAPAATKRPVASRKVPKRDDFPVKRPRRRDDVFVTDEEREDFRLDGDGIGHFDRVEVTIDYCDQKGDITHRRITVLHAFAAYAGTIGLRCHCHLRNERRTFLVENIRNFFDDDGSIIDPRTFLAEELHIALWKRELKAKAPRHRFS